MTRDALTDITFVLDRSGSMQSIKGATIQAFNGFLNSQRQGAGMAQMTLVQFDDQYELVYGAVPLSQAAELTDAGFCPRGSTALLDAIGRSIVATGKRLAQIPEDERPGTVIFVTLTDGEENASREFTVARINQMISEQRDRYAWQFIFLGANQDAIATAAQLGVAAAQAMTFSPTAAGTLGCVDAFDKKLHRVRSARVNSLPSSPLAFDAEDRKEAFLD